MPNQKWYRDLLWYPVNGSIRGNWLLLIKPYLQMWWKEDWIVAVAVRDDVECSSAATTRWPRSNLVSRLIYNEVATSQNAVVHEPPQSPQHNIHCHQTKLLEQDNDITSIKRTHTTSGVSRMTNNDKTAQLCFFRDSMDQRRSACDGTGDEWTLCSSGTPGMKILQSTQQQCGITAQ